MDILKNSRARIVKELVALVQRPPRDFSKPYNVTAGAIGASGMGVVGAWTGAHIGLAALGTAVSGAWILAPIFAVIGLAFGAASSSDE